MSNIIIEKKNEATLYITSDDSGITMELSEFFTFMAPGYKFMPAYRNKMWDGKVRLYNRMNSTIPSGLLSEVLQFANDRNYQINLDPDIHNRFSYNEDFINDLSLCSGRSAIEVRDYQKKAFEFATDNGKGILVSPTGSGKSLIIYMLIRYFLREDFDKKVIIIVPTTSLVEQMYKDFADYSSDDSDFDVEEDVHRIYSGKEKTFEQSVVITTWQSAIKLPPIWFEQFGCVIGDEAHTFKAKSLTTIMSRLSNAEMRIGTTGTLDGGQVNELTLTGNFGPVYKVTTTQSLIESDTLADLKIKALVLKYNDLTRKGFGKQTYADEISFIVAHEQRNRFITNLALDQTGNTLVLYNLVKKHGEPLFKQIRDRAGKRKVFFVSGSVNAEEREKIRTLTEKENGAIIVASSGTFSTGINIKNLHNIIFASPSKSQIRVLQSIGRGLRKSENGQGTVVYDIADDISWKRRKNYTLNHAVERVKIYNKEKFDYQIYEVPLL
jgi:superfamily II DNA or RNA helicase